MVNVNIILITVNNIWIQQCFYTVFYWVISILLGYLSIIYSIYYLFYVLYLYNRYSSSGLAHVHFHQSLMSIPTFPHTLYWIHSVYAIPCMGHESQSNPPDSLYLNYSIYKIVRSIQDSNLEPTTANKLIEWKLLAWKFTMEVTFFIWILLENLNF